MKIVKWLDENKAIGLLLLRIFIGIRIGYGVADNVISWQHMLAFESFLQTYRFPFPLLSALVSVYAQLVCSVLIIAGFYIRPASLVMIINFSVALLMVHRQDSFEAMTPALSMLSANILFLFYGAGKYSLASPGPDVPHQP